MDVTSGSICSISFGTQSIMDEVDIQQNRSVKTQSMAMGSHIRLTGGGIQSVVSKENCRWDRNSCWFWMGSNEGYQGEEKDRHEAFYII